MELSVVSREGEPGGELELEETKQKGKTEDGALRNSNLYTFPSERKEGFKQLIQKKQSEKHT